MSEPAQVSELQFIAMSMQRIAVAFERIASAQEARTHAELRKLQALADIANAIPFSGTGVPTRSDP